MAEPSCFEVQIGLSVVQKLLNCTSVWLDLQESTLMAIFVAALASIMVDNATCFELREIRGSIIIFDEWKIDDLVELQKKHDVVPLCV